MSGNSCSTWIVVWWILNWLQICVSASLRTVAAFEASFSSFSITKWTERAGLPMVIDQIWSPWTCLTPLIESKASVTSDKRIPDGIPYFFFFFFETQRRGKKKIKRWIYLPSKHV